MNAEWLLVPVMIVSSWLSPGWKPAWPAHASLLTFPVLLLAWALLPAAACSRGGWLATSVLLARVGVLHSSGFTEVSGSLTRPPFSWLSFISKLFRGSWPPKRFSLARSAGAEETGSKSNENPGDTPARSTWSRRSPLPGGADANGAATLGGGLAISHKTNAVVIRPSAVLTGVYLEQLKTRPHKGFTRLLVAALFIIAKTRKQLRCPWRWMGHLWYIHRRNITQFQGETSSLATKTHWGSLNYIPKSKDSVWKGCRRRFQRLSDSGKGSSVDRGRL